MNCEKCSHIKIHDRVYPDGTRSLTCTKYKTFLGFIHENNVLEKRNVSECSGIHIFTKNKNYVDRPKHIENKRGRRGAVKDVPTGITYSKRDKKYEVRFSHKGKYIYLGRTADLESAKRLLENWKAANRCG